MARIHGCLLALPICVVPSSGPVASTPATHVSPVSSVDGHLPPADLAVVRTSSVGAAGGDRHPDDRELAPAERLVRVLKDRGQPLAKRAEAARELGRIKYLPAIPVLLDQIALPEPQSAVPPSLSSLTDDPFDDLDRKGPCIDALKAYGREAILPAVRRYLASRAAAHRDYLRTVLTFNNHYQVQEAIRTVRQSVTDPQQVRLLAELFEWVSGDPADLNRPPPGVYQPILPPGPHRWGR